MIFGNNGGSNISQVFLWSCSPLRASFPLIHTSTKISAKSSSIYHVKHSLEWTQSLSFKKDKSWSFFSEVNTAKSFFNYKQKSFESYNFSPFSVIVLRLFNIWLISFVLFSSFATSSPFWEISNSHSWKLTCGQIFKVNSWKLTCRLGVPKKCGRKKVKRKISIYTLVKCTWNKHITMLQKYIPLCVFCWLGLSQ